jgi:hypothetical protein
MPAPRIRSDYGALQQVAQTFSRRVSGPTRIAL